MIQVGIIGCGGIVERRHGPAFLSIPERVNIAAISDLSEERLALMGEKLGVGAEHCYTDYQKMLASEELDLVDIATPHGLHEQQVTAAAEAGAHILLEKPIARTVEEADRMIMTSAERRVKFCVIHNQLFMPASQTVLKTVSDGVIGEPFLIRSEGLSGGHVVGRGTNKDWRTTYSGGGGGPLIDNGYHQIYKARAWIGSPVKRVFAHIGTYVQDIEVEDLALLLMEHENGSTTSLQVGWCAPGGAIRMEEIHGKKGSIRVSLGSDKPVSVWQAETKNCTYPEVEKEGHDEFGFPYLLRHYLDEIESDDPAPVTGEDAREILSIISAAYESGRSGKPVEI